MDASITLHELAQEISKIQHMLPGKLCKISQGPKGPYYNIQSWQNGENITTYVPRDRVDEFKEAIDGYQHFLSLTKKYSQQVISQTRAELSGGAKKKPSHRRSSSLRKKKSNN